MWHTNRIAVAGAGLLLTAFLGGCLSDSGGGGGGHRHVHHLYVAHEGSLLAYDIGKGEQLPGEIVDVSGPTDMQALENGTVMVNLSNRNEVLVVDGESMVQIKRIPSALSGSQAVRPVHSYITPKRNGKQYWMALNDGPSTGNAAQFNSALFIDISTPSDPASIKAVGEVGLGVGHHKASFSKTLQRVVISNISGNDKVLGVYDYTDPASIQELAAWSTADLGIQGSASPHGCGTSTLNGKVYCNATGTGDIISVDVDATPPTAKALRTAGSGGGYTKGHGRYVYSLQTSPREGDTTRPGSTCQVGQIAVIDGQSDSVVKQVPVKYDGPNCNTTIIGAPHATAGPGHIKITGNRMFVQLASGFSDPTGYADKHLVLDISDPANPVQQASLGIGKSRSHHGEILSGDDKYFFVANNLDGTVTQIDAQAGSVAKTLTTRANPRTLATWHEHEGPSHQTGPLE